jgi:hypothetical protein
MSGKYDPPNKAQVGRPTKFNNEVLGRLYSALADGMPIKGACVVAGIGVSTLADWRERDSQIEDAMSEARECARQKALSAIKAAGEKDWRANAEWLRLSFPADYRGNANKIEVNATASASSFVVTVDKQRELQERRRAALESLRRPNES